jgi:hypothetical protein
VVACANALAANGQPLELKWADEAGIEWGNLSGERDYDARRAYCQSKLASCLMPIELARRFASKTTTADAMYSSHVLTDLQQLA